MANKYYNVDPFVLWQEDHAWAHQPKFDFFTALFDDQAFPTLPCNPIKLLQTELVPMSDYAITANLTVPDPQEITMPTNVHEGMVDNTVVMRTLMQSDSARGFIKAIDKASGWRVILEDICREYWYWLAMVSLTPLEFFNLFKEALARCSFHPVPVKLPNSIDTYTRLDNRDFVEAFKDVVHHLSQPNELIRLCRKLSSMGKAFINHCYA
ncbi:hypothetical protein SCLCIDRAFT_25910 [Scleroderma citrinum Foug A]|uniref:Uncharacterized protein n=1 Tax=Scleroderma citrinum Foug A TaxID=1036808 RepID=A0A0C3DL60_9AGAM|nr:hypothetical protein SCLCIDRAFT_25910 [Scleroderma citrinum Foug A]